MLRLATRSRRASSRLRQVSCNTQSTISGGCSSQRDASIIFKYCLARTFSSTSSRKADITLTVDGKEVTVPQGTGTGSPQERSC